MEGVWAGLREGCCGKQVFDGEGDAFQTEGREQAKAWRRDGTSRLARRLAPPTTPALVPLTWPSSDLGWERERISRVSAQRAVAKELTALGGGTEW